MILDDTEWFQTQRRVQAENAPLVDEWKKLYATPVKSEFESAIEREITEFVERVGLYEHPTSTRPRWKTDKEMYQAFWNERLN